MNEKQNVFWQNIGNTFRNTIDFEIRIEPNERASMCQILVFEINSFYVVVCTIPYRQTIFLLLKTCFAMSNEGE